MKLESLWILTNLAYGEVSDTKLILSHSMNLLGIVNDLLCSKEKDLMMME
jgi:hypothetical protein